MKLFSIEALNFETDETAYFDLVEKGETFFG